MKKLFEQLIFDESPLCGFEAADVFSSQSISYIHEGTNGICRSFGKEITGTSVRSFDKEKGQGLLHIHDGPISKSNWFEKSRIVPTTYSLLPHNQVDFDCHIPEYTLLEFDVGDLFRKLSSLAKEKGYLLDNIITQYFVSIFKLANSHGVRGYGYQTYFEVKLDIINIESVNMHSIYKITDFVDLGCIQSMFNHVLPDTKLKSACTPQPELILLSTSAVYELVYLLLFFLTDSMMKIGGTFFADNPDRIIGAQIISPLINITENSPHNKTVGGTIDSEGTLRKPVKIIDDGKLARFLASYSSGMECEPTGSAYRAEYNIPPQTKATSVYVETGKFHAEEIIQRSDFISIVDSFHGLVESIDRLTLNFTAILDMKTFNYGKCLGSQSIKINSNLLKVLSNISEISANCEYEGDGGFLIPSMLCCLSDIGKIVDG